MNKLQCFKVTCEDACGNKYEVGVMTTDKVAAMKCAEHSLFEGRHIKTTAVDAIETTTI